MRSILIQVDLIGQIYQGLIQVYDNITPISWREGGRKQIQIPPSPNIRNITIHRNIAIHVKLMGTHIMILPTAILIQDKSIIVHHVLKDGININHPVTSVEAE